MGSWREHNAGLTLIELLVVITILSILATGILPLSQMSYKRTREIELRQNLRVIRKAIDQYKQLVDEQKITVQALSSGYPETLEILVKGVEVGSGPVPVKMKFLRHIPRDPMTEDGEWGLRSYFDDYQSDIWGGQDVYDVYSKSDKQALDGSNYRDW